MRQVTDLLRVWDEGVEMDPNTIEQIKLASELPIIAGPIALMPDAHVGKGSTVGSVIPTEGALIPATVGVDLGCGMSWLRYDYSAASLKGLEALRQSIERFVPVGAKDKGSFFYEKVSHETAQIWDAYLADGFTRMTARHRDLKTRTHPIRQLGTLGGGNHFIEIVRDSQGYLGIMLHSGSRGIGNTIGSFFIERARMEAEVDGLVLKDKDLAWLREGRPSYDSYVECMNWAQEYARVNRECMMRMVRLAIMYHLGKEPAILQEVSCHHNFTQQEMHPIDGEMKKVWITRKGAVQASKNYYVIIPGAMGRKSFIAKGLGNPTSYSSCSHGAGRRLSRGKAKEQITIEQLAEATAKVECRKDAGVLDEAPQAYKDIDSVMHAQRDLVKPHLELEALICIKG